MKELSRLDYKVLKFIDNNGHVSGSQIMRRFGNTNGIFNRMYNLRKFIVRTCPNSDESRPWGADDYYQLHVNGLNAIQNYKVERRPKRVKYVITFIISFLMLILGVMNYFKIDLIKLLSSQGK